MLMNEFDNKFKYFKSHDNITIECEKCGSIRNPLKTRAKQTIIKTGLYLCSSCGQSYKHKMKPMTKETKNKISETLIKKYKKSPEN
jgi:uncharacterized Zn finger protein